MDLYLDTNIFIYLADNSSQFNKSCRDLIKFCQKHKIRIITSTETFQEIIHYAKNTKQLTSGIIIAEKVLLLTDGIYSIDKKTIEVYLKQVRKYPSAKSRDLIHLAVCLENGIAEIVTFDKDFKQFKEIRTITPDNLLSNAGSGK